MPITNLWDVTFPPDTQLANLLGQDLRNFRLDTQQRMAAISGTLANRWNPGADAQPANWQGLLYFTTDTNQIFQWSGAAWVDVTATLSIGRYKFEGSNVVPVTVANSVALSPLQGIVIPANDIGIGQAFYAECSGSWGSLGNPTFTLGLYLDSVLVESIGFNMPAAAGQGWSIKAFFTGLTTGAAGTILSGQLLWSSSQISGSFLQTNGQQANTSIVVDTTSSHTLRMQIQWGTASASNTITQSFMNCYRIG